MNIAFDFIRYLFEWVQVHKTIFVVLMVFSAISFFGTLAAVPILLIRLPADYFAPDRRRPRVAADRPIRRFLFLMLKNIAGIIIIAAGVAMLVLPGQGVLTILAGLMLLDFPGKYRIERRLIMQPKILRAVNQLRRRAGKDDLRLEADETD